MVTYVPEINAIFEQMEVPLAVLETPEKGKHIVASRDLPEGAELFEEIPLVSWPMDTLAEAGVDQCWWCLRVLTSSDVVSPATEVTTGGASTRRRRRWCSELCEGKSKALSAIITEQVEGSLAAFHEAERSRLDGTSLPISVLSVARCVGSIAARIIAMIERQNLSFEVLADPSVTRQVFSAATKAFNRLVEPPLHSEFKDINIDVWVDVLQRELRQPLTRALLRPLVALSTAAPAAADVSAASSSTPSAAPTTQVVKELVDALLLRATINTLVGQLTVNAQALNTVVPQLPGKPLSACIICMGAAVFTLQSNFNHSCTPNAMVSASPNRDHEIVVVAKRPIAKGEEVTISYIVTEGKSTAERQEELQSYFFTCQCPACSATSS